MDILVLKLDLQLKESMFLSQTEAITSAQEGKMVRVKPKMKEWLWGEEWTFLGQNLSSGTNWCGADQRDSIRKLESDDHT